MAPRTAPPFRADHVGSLLRPSSLLRARADRAAGTVTTDQQRAKLDLVVQTAAELWGS